MNGGASQADVSRAAGPDRGQPRLGLVLPGGGARTAYQVGVLQALAELLPEGAASPFPVIAGTSAGAINATVLATHALAFRRGVQYLAGVWANMRCDLVFRTDGLAMLGNALRWIAMLLRLGASHRRPHSLLDNTPLRHLLERHVVFARLQECIDAGALDALAITCSGYTTARAVTFYQGKAGLKPWHRTRRIGQPGELRLDHIMASVALPVIFPAVRLGREYMGDGSLRQAAPLSPAIHLGAERILVIGVRNEQANRLPAAGENVPYPSLGQLAGYLLDVIFMDSIYADLERLQRINDTLSRLPPAAAQPIGLKPIEARVIVPSEDIREIARRHRRAFPRNVRLLLRALGAMHQSGSQLLSYLLFEGAYCRELMELGRRDAHARADELLEFLGAARSAAGERPAEKPRL